jgi:hypothetical protein
MKQPSAFIPVAMSGAALLLVVAYAAVFGVHRLPDDGVVNICFQILLGAQLPVILFLVVRFLRRAPKETILVLAYQMAAAVAAFVMHAFLS